MAGDKRIATIVQTLKGAYPDAHIVLQYSTPWELLVAVILSAQCTDVTVNKVTEKLFAKYKTLDAYVRASLTEFEGDIKSTGFYHNKAKNVLAAAKLIKTTFNGNVPKTMAEMITIPGVGRKTANVVLGNAYGVVVGIAVDTHVRRLSQRLHLVDPKNADPVKIEKELMAVIPKKDWFVLTYLLIDHGRAICRAQNPNCAGCVLRDVCPSSRLQA
jgi:endonuclease III